MSSPKVLTPEEVDALTSSRSGLAEFLALRDSHEALRALVASTRRAALDEAIALVNDALPKGTPRRVLREKLEQLRDTPPPKETLDAARREDAATRTGEE